MKKRTVRRILIASFIMGVMMLITGIIYRNLLLILVGIFVTSGSVACRIVYELVLILEEEERIVTCFDDDE